MKIKALILAFLLSFSCPYNLSASSHLQVKTQRIEAHTEEHNPSTSSNQSLLRKSQQSNKQNNRVAFSTRSGFVLLRKEDIISICIDKRCGDILLSYWNKDKPAHAHCQRSLRQVLESLNDFPFYQVSRSSMVNLMQAREYIGTRRVAELLMNDGTSIKVSRNRAGKLHDWFSSLAI